MTSDVESFKSGSESDDNRSDEDIAQLEKDYRILHDQAQKLITERVSLESDINKLKKRTAGLVEEIRQLKSPPLIIGHIQDLLMTHSIISHFLLSLLLLIQLQFRF